VDVDAVSEGVRVGCGLGIRNRRVLLLTSDSSGNAPRRRWSWEYSAVGSAAPGFADNPGGDAGGRLDLLNAPGIAPPEAYSASPISPPARRRRPCGPRETPLALEGAAARFSGQRRRFHIDLSAAGHVPPGPLDWNPDELEIPVLGGLRLLVNSADPALLAPIPIRKLRRAPRWSSARS